MKLPGSLGQVVDVNSSSLVFLDTWAAQIQRRGQVLATALHALYLYGATGITLFGWAVCQILGWDAQPWLPLWFCAALFIYNADRLRPDPADGVNLPRREAAMRRLRTISAGLAGIAGVALIVVPVVRQDWPTLGLVLGGALICLNYTIPLLGFRFKDLPVIKTFFAPTIVALAVLGLPWIHEGRRVESALLAVTVLRVWGLLLFNMILCDLRDVDGDRHTGIVSLPTLLGELSTRRLLFALLLALEVLALIVAWQAPAEHATALRISCVLIPVYLGGLLAAVRVRRTERFYEWWVEGIFFLPALALLGQALVE